MAEALIAIVTIYTGAIILTWSTGTLIDVDFTVDTQEAWLTVAGILAILVFTPGPIPTGVAATLIKVHLTVST